MVRPLTRQPLTVGRQGVNLHSGWSVASDPPLPDPRRRCHSETQFYLNMHQTHRTKVFQHAVQFLSHNRKYLWMTSGYFNKHDKTLMPVSSAWRIPRVSLTRSLRNSGCRLCTRHPPGCWGDRCLRRQGVYFILSKIFCFRNPVLSADCGPLSFFFFPSQLLPISLF